MPYPLPLILYHMLASHGGAQPRDVLRLARLTQARLGPRTACGSHASLRLASALERPAARTPHHRLASALERPAARTPHHRLASALERPAARTTIASGSNRPLR